MKEGLKIKTLGKPADMLHKAYVKIDLFCPEYF